MTAERWAQIRKLFDEALELPASGREGFVRQSSNGDQELCDEALAMLRNSSEAEGLLDLTMLGRQWIRPATLARSLNPGQILAGRYRIVRPIGAGGMGEVYEAEDLDLGAPVALKTMSMADEDGLARFKLEIHLARTVTHPNVCRIFDLHRHHDRESGSVVTFLTMELVNGETLSEYLGRRGRLSPRDALPIVGQIAAALAAAHEKGVVHRDLKPGNVILTDNATRAVVTDFGLAYPMAQSTESTVTVVGTPAYMAPEQFEGKPVTGATDIYAFGALLYEMVVGRRPFNGDSPIALALEKIRGEPPRAGDSVPGLPLAWSAVIQQCLDPKPEHRFSDVRAALRRLQDSVDRPPLIRLSRLQKRLVAASALFLGLLALSGWRYAQSIYTPSREAVRLYRLGARAQQLLLPWKATQLYERAAESDGSFIAAHASAADAWMDLDQPQRARAELRRAGDSRPRWRRVAEYESLLEQAAQAKLRGDLAGSAALHQRARTAASDAERPDLLLGEAMALTRAGDRTGALVIYRSIPADSRCRCPAMLAAAVLSSPIDPVPARGLFEAAASCFENLGDLDGVAQSWYEFGNAWRTEPGNAEVYLQRTAAIARNTGNVEQEIMTAAFLSDLMLELGDDEAAFTAFSRAMQIADRSSLPFVTARLLERRGQFYFDEGDFLQSSNFDRLAQAVSRSAGMPWTYTRYLIRDARSSLRMELPRKAQGDLTQAREQLRQFPNAALSAEIADLTNAARYSHARAGDTLYQLRR